MDNIVCGRCSVSLIIQFRRCVFSKIEIFFRHLKLRQQFQLQMTISTIGTNQRILTLLGKFHTLKPTLVQRFITVIVTYQVGGGGRSVTNLCVDRHACIL